MYRFGKIQKPVILSEAEALRSAVERPLTIAGEDWQNLYAFETDEGTRGVLQVVGLTEKPPGVKLRYKLVRPAPAPAVPAIGHEEKSVPDSAATHADLQTAFAEYEQLLTALREATFDLDLADLAEGTEAERQKRRADIEARCQTLAGQTARLREKILALGQRAAEPRNR